MAQITEPAVGAMTAADLVERFGPILLSRIRSDPAPGTATEDDVAEIHLREDRLYELADGILVEKTMGAYESYLALVLGRLLGNYLAETRRGVLLGPDGMMRLAPGLVRIPDLSFISTGRLPGGKVPKVAIAGFAPDLAIEVISRSNTREEMERKLGEYFDAGVRQVWYVYHTPRREIHVFRSPADRAVLGEDATLEGGGLLPGFTLRVVQLFAEPPGD